MQWRFIKQMGDDVGDMRFRLNSSLQSDIKVRGGWRGEMEMEGMGKERGWRGIWEGRAMGGGGGGESGGGGGEGEGRGGGERGRDLGERFANGR